MRAEEYDEFASEIKQLCSTLGKRFDDALAKAYWRALKDASLDEVQAHVERVLLTATSETKFPKPAQLRSTPPRISQRCADPEFREAEKRSAINLEELRARDLAEWERVMRGKPCVQLVRQYGSANVFFDVDEWCWRRVSRSHHA